MAEEPTFPTEDELLDGECADGSKPKLHSRNLYTGATKPFSKEPAEPPVADVVQNWQERTAARIKYDIDLQHLTDLELVADLLREVVSDGLQAKREDRAGESAPPEPAPAATPPDTGATATGEAPVPHAPVPRETLDLSTQATEEQAGAFTRLKLATDVPQVAANPFAYTGNVRGPRVAGSEPSEAENAAPEPAESGTEPEHKKTPRAKGGRRQQSDADKPLNRAQRIAMALSAGKLLVVVAAKRAEVAHKLVDAATKLDLRESFMEDRAVAVVNGLLLHLDKEWRELGFGAWMPFRWPDQWLSFCGVLRRVLAANGLIHSRHADTYRRLLDETPPVELEGHVKDRAKESKTPLNPAQCKMNQGARTMSELKTRLQSEFWGPKEERRKVWDNYWDTQQGADPP